MVGWWLGERRYIRSQPLLHTVAASTPRGCSPHDPISPSRARWHAAEYYTPHGLQRALIGLANSRVKNGSAPTSLGVRERVKGRLGQNGPEELGVSGRSHGLHRVGLSAGVRVGRSAQRPAGRGRRRRPERSTRRARSAAGYLRAMRRGDEQGGDTIILVPSAEMHLRVV